MKCLKEGTYVLTNKQVSGKRKLQRLYVKKASLALRESPFLSKKKNIIKEMINNLKLILLYDNPLLERNKILEENTNKSGIYVWINKLNNKFYIGSSKDLGNKVSGRLNRYFRPSYLKSTKEKV